MVEPPLRRAVFIDRDGVINEERHYVHRVEDFVFLPGVIEGLSRLQAAGLALVVVTNQAGIARGHYGEAEYEALTGHMRSVLRASGIELTGVYHCPHHPDVPMGINGGSCNCRKPAPGMLLRAASELSLNLRRSVLIGDKLSDIAAGRAAGLAHCVLVRSGHAFSKSEAAQADVCRAGLAEAAQWLLDSPGSSNRA